MNKTYLFVFVLLAISCKNQVSLPTSHESFFEPPGTVEVANNLYCDQTEITNMDWQEYVYWNKNNHGDHSIEYLGSLPDTTVWENLRSYGEAMRVNRFKHPAYQYYPVVGVSRNQALQYTEWRTRRVIEMILVNQEDTRIDNSNLDSILKIKGSSEHLIPVYRLPKETEIVLIQDSYKSLKNEFNTSFGSPHGVKYCSKYCTVIHELESNANEYLEDGQMGMFPDAFGKEVQIYDKENEVNAWTGFRNMCSWVTVDEYLESLNQ
ncbi:MAG: formylglycine-generating enzyme family protein [Schleiferiaceae bacterium]|jgi:hypothetical protein|nr:formylglycine-generating enzyme family protein [Schleiferiaceae bacterium]